MLEGKCPKCGTYYYGWALLNPRHQSCPTCGRGLEIKNTDSSIFKGFSPFDADEYILKPLKNISHRKPEDKDSDVKDD